MENKTTRRSNQNPLEKIANDDDLLSTNAFVSGTNVNDLSHSEKKNFRNYYSEKNIKKIQYTEDNEVSKSNKNIIKTERETIISIDTKDRNKNAYPNPNNVSMSFGKSFYNVKKIKLISTEFPNTDQVIRDTPVQIRNNRISWENKEDFDLGIYEDVPLFTSSPDTVDLVVEDYRFLSQLPQENYFVCIYECTIPELNGKRIARIINDTTLRLDFKGGIAFHATAKVDLGVPNYTIDITPGNYTVRSIADEIRRKMNLVKRRNGTIDLFHFFTVEVDVSTDIITFSSYITRQLTSDPFETAIASGDIQVTLLSHGYKVGDQFLITGAKNIGGIEAVVLNDLFTVKSVINLNTFVYEVNDRANEARVGGGFTVKVGRPSEFRLLFLTGKSLIVDNIGFPEEDSSVSINQNDPIRTKVLSISNAVNLGNFIRFTTTEPHMFRSSIISEIISISISGEVITNTPHNLADNTNVELADTDTVPKLSGVFAVLNTGNFSFRLINAEIKQAGTTGFVKHSGDRISLYNFRTSPKLLTQGFSVENTPTPNEFDIRADVSFIDMDSILKTVVGVGQIIVTHPNHGFNEILLIQNGSSSGRILITTKTNHGLFGIKFTGVLIESTSGSNVDIVIPTHPFSTSDVIRITSPNLSGEFFIEKIDDDTIRIDSRLGNIPASLGEVHFGDMAVFNATDCVPSLVLNIDREPLFQVITQGFAPNQFEIQAGFELTTSGTTGIIGRDNKVCLNRIISQEPNSSLFAGIPLNVINRKYHTISEIISENQYIIRLFQNFSTGNVQSGGNSVVVSSKIHGKKVFQSNTFNGEKQGVLFKSISLEGENYVLLTSPNLSTVYSVGSQQEGDIFAKILLSEPPGVMMFNSFISAPKEFNPPLANIDNINFQIKRRDGYLYNFNNTDFSMSISIIESVDRIKDTYISSRTGLSELYEINS